MIRIDSELEKADLPKAELDINEHWFSIVFHRKLKFINLNDEKFDVVDYHLNSKQRAIIEFCWKEAKSRTEIFDFLKMVNSTL